MVSRLVATVSSMAGIFPRALRFINVSVLRRERISATTSHYTYTPLYPLLPQGANLSEGVTAGRS